MFGTPGRSPGIPEIPDMFSSVRVEGALFVRPKGMDRVDVAITTDDGAGGILGEYFV